MIHIALLQYMIQKVHPDQCLLATVALAILMQSPQSWTKWVVNVFVIIWRHGYGLSYAALLIVHLIFFQVSKK